MMLSDVVPFKNKG